MSEYRYLLDTNILSDLIKNPAGPVAQKVISPHIELICCTNLIVACELRYGACKKGSPRLTARVEQLLSTLPVLPWRKMLRISTERSGPPWSVPVSPSGATTC